eukprot:15340911-Ditylum_brightwellii.AAC.1
MVHWNYSFNKEVRKCSYVIGGVLNSYVKKLVFLLEIGYCVCVHMARLLKDIKVPQKRCVHIKKAPVPESKEDVDRDTRRLKREWLIDPIRVTKRTRSVRVVIHGNNDEILDLTRQRGRKEYFELRMREAMKKHKKVFGKMVVRE